MQGSADRTKNGHTTKGAGEEEVYTKTEQNQLS